MSQEVVMAEKTIYWFDELDIQAQEIAKEEIREYLNEIIDALKHGEGKSAELEYFIKLSRSFERISRQVLFNKDGTLKRDYCSWRFKAYNYREFN